MVRTALLGGSESMGRWVGMETERRQVLLQKRSCSCFTRLEFLPFFPSNQRLNYKPLTSIFPVTAFRLDF